MTSPTLFLIQILLIDSGVRRSRSTSRILMSLRRPPSVYFPNLTPPIMALTVFPMAAMLTPLAAALVRSGITWTSGMPSW